MPFPICSTCKAAIEGHHPRHLTTIRANAWEKYGYGEYLDADHPLPNLKIIGAADPDMEDCELCGAVGAVAEAEVDWSSS